jgi:hypothetical protein
MLPGMLNRTSRNIFASSEQKSRQTSFFVPSGFTSLEIIGTKVL